MARKYTWVLEIQTNTPDGIIIRYAFERDEFDATKFAWEWIRKFAPKSNLLSVKKWDYRNPPIDKDNKFWPIETWEERQERIIKKS